MKSKVKKDLLPEHIDHILDYFNFNELMVSRSISSLWKNLAEDKLKKYRVIDAITKVSAAVIYYAIPEKDQPDSYYAAHFKCVLDLPLDDRFFIHIADVMYKNYLHGKVSLERFQFCIQTFSKMTLIIKDEWKNKLAVILIRLMDINQWKYRDNAILNSLKIKSLPFKNHYPLLLESQTYNSLCTIFSTLISVHFFVKLNTLTLYNDNNLILNFNSQLHLILKLINNTKIENVYVPIIKNMYSAYKDRCNIPFLVLVSFLMSNQKENYDNLKIRKNIDNALEELFNDQYMKIYRNLFKEKKTPFISKQLFNIFYSSLNSFNFPIAIEILKSGAFEITEANKEITRLKLAESFVDSIAFYLNNKLNHDFQFMNFLQDFQSIIKLVSKWISPATIFDQVEREVVKKLPIPLCELVDMKKLSLIFIFELDDVSLCCMGV